MATMSNLALYLVTVVAWGSTWLAINFQLGEVAPEVSLVYRYLIAAGLLFGWCLAKRKPLRFGLHAHLRFAQMGVLLFGLNYIATYSAQQYISSALNATAFSTMVWMNIINARIFLGTRIEPPVYLGASLGMIGIVTMFWPEVSQLSLSDKTVYGSALCLSGALLASFGNIVSQKAQMQQLPNMQSNAWGMFYGAVFTALVALRQGENFNFEMSFAYTSSLLYLAVFGSVVAFGCYLTLLGRIGPHRAGYVVVMFPVVALLLSIVFEGLQITPQILIGVTLVLGGNAVILAGGTSSARPASRRFSTAASPALADPS
jgi:drug/metabolite transporter (DMT)-like permease